MTTQLFQVLEAIYEVQYTRIFVPRLSGKNSIRALRVLLMFVHMYNMHCIMHMKVATFIYRSDILIMQPLIPSFEYLLSMF